MTEIIRNEFAAEPNVAVKPAPDPNATDSEFRTFPTPPLTDSRSRTIANGPTTGAAAAVGLEGERVPLFIPNEADELRARWDTVQVGFVDEPRKAVHEADALVSTTVKRLSEIFGDERQKLEKQLDGGDISTEDLRLALRRYRSFFTRLLSI